MSQDHHSTIMKTLVHILVPVPLDMACEIIEKGILKTSHLLHTTCLGLTLADRFNTKIGK